MVKGILVVESKSMHAVTMQMHSYAILYHDFRSDQISTRLSTTYQSISVSNFLCMVEIKLIIGNST